MLNTVVALSALIEIVCWVGTAPVVHALAPSDVAVFPGVIVIVQLPFAASDGPQFEVAVVPEGQFGGLLTKRFDVALLPVLVTSMVLATPEVGVGVPGRPYSV